MLIFKEFYLKLKSQFKIEPILNTSVALMILIIAIFAVLALIRPINTAHYHNVERLATQEVYSDTQKVALSLLAKEVIYTADYFRLMHAYQLEKQQIKTYPAMAIEDE